MRIGGKWNGTGATVYICCGFVPDYVFVWNVEGTAQLGSYWNKNFGSAEMVEGAALAGDFVVTEQTIGLGLQPYMGGEMLTSAMQTSTTYGEGVYLENDTLDYRRVINSSLGIVGDALLNDIDTWTLGSSTNYTGNFNADVTGTYIGEGSPICIDGKWYTITALTASQGISANEVTISLPAKSGEIQYIGGKNGYKPCAVGSVTKPGFKLFNTTTNVNDAMMAFEAGTYDF